MLSPTLLSYEASTPVVEVLAQTRDAVVVGDTAWMLAATVAVFLMVPGIALFYGGMVSQRSTLNMMAMTIGAFGIVGVLWVAFGYSTVLGDSLGDLGLIGNPAEYAGLGQVVTDSSGGTEIPAALIAGFQLAFAIITVAIVSGAVADRMKYTAWLAFAGLWAVLVYFPVAHWVFAFDSDDGSVKGGWIANTLEAVDFAGGTAVHINSGISALVLAFLVGQRKGFGKGSSTPHNVPLTVLGAFLLFVGWFGFNVGSAVAADYAAGLVTLNNIAATSAGICGWLVVEHLRTKRMSILGGCSGMIAGLVGITPACGAVTPLGAVAIGLICGALCCVAVEWKYRFGLDDSLDVVGLHFVGGMLGTLLVGFFASPDAPNAATGLFYGGGFGLLGIQALAAVATCVYAVVVTAVIAIVLKKTIGLRVTEEEEDNLDASLHGESAYAAGVTLDTSASTGTSASTATTTATATPPSTSTTTSTSTTKVDA